jgi:hypothetical protein
MWNDKSLSNLLYFPNFCSAIDRLHLCHLKTPCCDSETFKVKVYLTVSRHFSAQSFSPVLVLAFAWQLFSSLHLCLAPCLGCLIVLQFHNWLTKFWTRTVLDFCQAVWLNMFLLLYCIINHNSESASQGEGCCIVVRDQYCGTELFPYTKECFQNDKR